MPFKYAVVDWLIAVILLRIHGGTRKGQLANKRCALANWVSSSSIVVSWCFLLWPRVISLLFLGKEEMKDTCSCSKNYCFPLCVLPKNSPALKLKKNEEEIAFEILLRRKELWWPRNLCQYSVFHGIIVSPALCSFCGFHNSIKFPKSLSWGPFQRSYSE